MSYCCKDKFKLQEVGDNFQLLQGGTVISVNGKTGAVTLTASDVGAKPASYEAPVSSVNEKTGAVVLDAGDIGYDGETTYPDGSAGAELSKINSALTSLSAVTEIIDTASGAIASFPDGSGLPMRSLLATIEPKQDLHGQDAPYPAGGGKNLLPMTLANMKTINYAGTWDGNVYTLAGVTFTINTDDGGNVTSITTNGTSTGTALLRLCNEITFAEETTLNGSPSAGGYNSFKLEADKVGSGVYQDIGNGINMPANTELTRIIILAPNGTVLNNTVFYPMVRLKSDSDATFAPYSNECPISGWTGLSGKRCGVNQWDEEWEVGAISTSTGQNTSSTTRIRSKNYVPVDPEKTFWFVGTGYNAEVLFYDKYKNFISKRSPDAPTAGGLLNQPSNCYFVRFTMYSGYGTTYRNDIGINCPSTDTAYHAYTSLPITCTWQTEAGTVYGGRVDVVSGAMVVYRAKLVLDSTIPSGTNGFRNISVLTNGVRAEYYPYRDVGAVGKSVISDKFVYGDVSTGTPFTVGTAGNNSRMYVTLPTEYNTEALIRSWFASNPSEFVYYLATPQTYQLTPQQIETLLGNNTVFVDCGSVSVTYQASIKGYIDKVLAS